MQPPTIAEMHTLRSQFLTSPKRQAFFEQKNIDIKPFNARLRQKHRQQVYYLDNGDTYVGQCDERGLYDGFGIYVFRDRGYRFVGEFSQGRKLGYGEYYKVKEGGGGVDGVGSGGREDEIMDRNGLFFDNDSLSKITYSTYSEFNIVTHNDILLGGIGECTCGGLSFQPIQQSLPKKNADPQFLKAVEQFSQKIQKQSARIRTRQTGDTSPDSHPQAPKADFKNLPSQRATLELPNGHKLKGYFENGKFRVPSWQGYEWANGAKFVGKLGRNSQGYVLRGGVVEKDGRGYQV